MSSTSARRGTRLATDDWTDAALEVLRTQGRAGITINALCDHLGVTRGSFYWHFADLDALKEAVTERWCKDTGQVLEALAVLQQLPPVDRVRAMTMHLLDEGSSSIEVALRDWARTDAKVAEAVAEADRTVFAAVEQALVQIGRSAADARVLAGVLVYAGIGFAHGDHGLPRPTPDEVDRLLTLIT